MLKQIDHVGIAVFKLDESLKRYSDLFKVKASHIETMPALSIRIAFIPVGGVMLELIESLAPGKGRIGEFLEKQGEGIHHVAYRVENLAAILDEMKGRGIGLRDEKPRPGGDDSLVAFISPGETDNVLTELVERPHGFGFERKKT